MSKGLRVIAWIFAFPFLIIGALWIWRGAVKATRDVTQAAPSGSTTAASPAITNSQKVSSATTPQPTTIQQITAGVSAATDLFTSLGNLIPSNSDYQPDPTESLISPTGDALLTADVSSIL